MAKSTVYPYGTDGELPSSIGLINDLETGGVDKALSAEMGVFLRDTLGDEFFSVVEDVDTSGLTVQNASLTSTNKWYYSGGVGRHIAVPVSAGDSYRLSVTSISGTFEHDRFYGWVTSSYNPPYANNATVPFVRSQTGRYATSEADAPIIVTAPGDAEYLILCTVDGGGDKCSWEVQHYVAGVAPSVSERIVAIEKTIDNLPSVDFVGGPEENIDTSSLTIQDCTLGTSTWYKSNSIGRHIAIPVTAGDSYRIVRHGNYNWYGFVTSSYNPPYTDGSSIPYVSGGGRVQLASGVTDAIIIAPSDAAYLVLTTVDGGGVAATWSAYHLLDEANSTLSEDVSALKGAVDFIDKSYASVTYAGEKIVVKSSWTCGIKPAGALSSGYQGMAIYGDYLFRTASTSGNVQVYDISGSSPSLVATYSISGGLGHGNSLQFAPVVASGNDFPYLYVAALSSTMYVLLPTSSGISIVQTITTDFTTGNLQIGDDGYLYSFYLYSDNHLYFKKIRGVSVSEGDIVLTNNDIIDEWHSEEEYDSSTYVYQGGVIHDGKIFFLYGGTYGPRGIWVYDIASHRKLANIPLDSSISYELEDCDFYGDILYIACLESQMYAVKF